MTITYHLAASFRYGLPAENKYSLLACNIYVFDTASFVFSRSLHMIRAKIRCWPKWLLVSVLKTIGK